jgi:hypothetical protein
MMMRMMSLGVKSRRCGLLVMMLMMMLMMMMTTTVSPCYT